MPTVKPFFPIGPAQVNFHNWRLAGCRLMYFFPCNIRGSFVGAGSPRSTTEAVTGIQTSITTAELSTFGNDSASRWARGVMQGTTTQNVCSIPRASLPFAAPSLPVAIMARACLLTATTNGIFCYGANNNTLSGFFMHFNATRQLVCGFGDNGGTTATDWRVKTSTTQVTLGKYYDVACIIRAATDISIYINGVDDGGTLAGTGGAMVYGGPLATLGFSNQGGLQHANIDYVMGILPPDNSSIIDPSVIANVQADPWALITGQDFWPPQSHARKRHKIIAASLSQKRWNVFVTT